MRKGTMAETTPRLDETEIHDVLRNDRRRLTLRCLRETEDMALSLGELSERVAALETGESPPPRDKRQSVYVSLQQTHLPKLEELDVVEYDTDRKSVSLRDRVEEIEVYMEVVPQYGLSWGEFYFALGLVGLLTTIAVSLGSVLFGNLPPMVVSAVLFLVLIGSSAYHVYTHQDRLPHQRFFS